MGGHGPDYYERSPDSLKDFRPKCRSNALQKCSAQEVVNATDDSMARAVARLKAHEQHWAPAPSYIPDHSGSLGEGNLLSQTRRDQS